MDKDFPRAVLKHISFLLDYLVSCNIFPIYYPSVGPPRGRVAEYSQEEAPHTGGTPYSSRNSAGARQVYDSSVGKGEILLLLFVWDDSKL